MWAPQTRHDPEGRRRYKGAANLGLYQRGWTGEDVRQLLRVIAWLLGLFGAVGRRLMSRVRKIDDFDALNELLRASASKSLQGIRERLAKRNG